MRGFAEALSPLELSRARSRSSACHTSRSGPRQCIKRHALCMISAAFMLILCLISHDFSNEFMLKRINLSLVF